MDGGYGAGVTRLAERRPFLATPTLAMMKTDTHEFLTRDEFRVAMARVDAQFAELRVDFEREINDAFAAQTRTLVIGLITAVILIALTNGLAIVAG